MLAVAIVALFLGSAKSLALGVPLEIASVYLIYSGVHVIGSRVRKANPVTTSAGSADWIDWISRLFVATLVGFVGLVWGMLAISHKCSAGSRAFELVAPFGFAVLCAGNLIACRRYAVGLLIVIVLFALALLGGSYYKEVVHKGSPEAMSTPPNHVTSLDAATTFMFHVESYRRGAGEFVRWTQ